MENRRENVVLFPFMAQGHIIPFFALAQKIEKHGYSITYVNTPLNIKKLQRSLLPGSSIKLVEIPFNSTEHGLPLGAENSDSLPHNLLFSLLQATMSFKIPFKKLLFDIIQEQGSVKPVCVIADFFFGWTVDIAHEFGIFHSIFSANGGFGMACFYSMWLNLPHKNIDGGFGKEDSTVLYSIIEEEKLKSHSLYCPDVFSRECAEFLLPDFPEAGKHHVTQLSPSLKMAGKNNPLTEYHRKNLPTWANSDAILLNTVEELDKLGLMYFRRKLGIPVYAIGPALLSENVRSSRAGKEATISPDKCIEWLDKKEVKSVLYICFGSMNTISASHMMQLAKSLDASGINFIWVVRPPIGFDINAKFVADKWLPDGFLGRIQDHERGLIIDTWAPQVEILSHKSVAAFLSHCGWNSVLESLTSGVPLISWPVGAEQFHNAKFLVEEVGVCVEMARGTNFEVSQEGIIEKIEFFMGGSEKLKEIKRKSCEVEEIMKNAIRDEEICRGSSVKAMEEFFKAALLMKDGTKNTN
ncbi:UDP-glycosyltransferase 92A1-like isoform X1 [Olea europaea var. sylvestris]|uniref:UDP-glycosyltransferase 92A1-like isoform X1 n=1 Tax=Olea europaea var. sylvestris TaxID=158386 RepID=UPI000C1D68B5|nr:UDP-glycosyltransferase 92A1-like isoform X1 [Olea europaea var. sylvestris]